MNLRTKLSIFLALGAIAGASVNQAYAAPFGTIRGFVKDGQGNPLVGAAVVVVADSERYRSEKIVRRASTDGDGRFIATGIMPGRYRIKAEATGFSPVEIDALVKPNKVTVFDSILLRRIGTLAEETTLKADPKYAARSAQGTIFHANEPADKDSQPLPLTDRTPETHGYLYAFSQSSPGSNPASGSYVGANFAVSQHVAKVANVVVSGQLGYGEGAPQRLETLTTASAGDRHRLAVALGYGRFTISRRGAPRTLAQYSLSASDTWQVSGPVLVVYGVEFARFADGNGGTSLLPRLGFSLDAGPRTRLFGGLTPGSSVDAQSRINLESGEIVFSESKPVPLTSSNDPILDRSYRLAFGGEQLLSDSSSVEMMAFFDTISGQGVGLLAIPTDPGLGEPAVQNRELRGRSRGLRLVYRKRLGKSFEGAVGYAFGEGQHLSGGRLDHPANLFANGLFQIVSAKIDANFVSTGTKVSTVLRLAPGHAVFAIDPFQGQMATYDPNLSVLVTQELPSIGVVPGQWAVVLDMRNLLDQQASVSDERQELIASRFHRLVRVGLSLRF